MNSLNRHIGFPFGCVAATAQLVASGFCITYHFALTRSQLTFGRGLTFISSGRTVFPEMWCTYIYAPYLRYAPRSVPSVALDTNESIAITTYHDKQGTKVRNQKSV
jgi:hypothetical protein